MHRRHKVRHPQIRLPMNEGHPTMRGSSVRRRSGFEQLGSHI